MNYFPLLRGKKNEVLTLRKLSNEISSSSAIVPIIEPVNWNSTTKIGIRMFIKDSMRFLLICNPKYGEFKTDSSLLEREIDNIGLMNYPSWIPSMYVSEMTQPTTISSFTRKFNRNYPIAFIYYGRPDNAESMSEIQAADVAHQVFVENRVDRSYLQTISLDKLVLMRDNFRRRRRNADYPDIEFFTDMNTHAGNPKGVNFGDFSIVGDFYQERGGPPHAVALHHIHFDSKSNNLMVSHFISDRRMTPVDREGKTIEALTHLVNSLDILSPNDTQTCDEYRKLFDDKHAPDLGTMKGLMIKQHLETILNQNGLER